MGEVHDTLPKNDKATNQERGPPRGLGNRGKRVFISGEQWPKFEGNRGTNTIMGNREHRKTNFSIFGEQGNKPIYFRGTREQVTPPPPTEGRKNQLFYCYENSGYANS